jgi:hypothetical protein
MDGLERIDVRVFYIQHIVIHIVRI